MESIIHFKEIFNYHELFEIIEPTSVKASIHAAQILNGIEPLPPKRMVPKTIALDDSATLPFLYTVPGIELFFQLKYSIFFVDVLFFHS